MSQHTYVDPVDRALTDPVIGPAEPRGHTFTMSQFDVLGTPVHSISLADLLDSFDEGLLIFHNMDTLRKSQRHEEFGRVSRSADFAVIDGQAVRFLVSSLCGVPAHKVSGSDFLPIFCDAHAATGSAKVFFLGAGPGVADEAMTRLNKGAENPVVVGAHSPSFQLLDDREESD